MKKIKLKDIIPYILMFPSILIGTLAMISYGVASNIWIQNIIIWIVGSILGCVFISKARQKYFSKDIDSLTIVIITLLVSTFWFNGLNGVHRWLSFGPINLYVASIFLPLLIIRLWKMTEKNYIFYVIALNLIVLVILLLHPDAGQVSSFACATTILLWKKINNRMLKIFNLTLTSIMVIISWVFLDDLAPVPYVEHIIFLVADMGIVWFILGVISLILLLIPFFFYGKESIIILSLGVYFLTMILVTFFGNFPMPIMGYGTSPVIGYIFAITWLNHNKKISAV